MENIAEYFAKRQCDYWREYPHSYGLLNVYKRRVQVIGADCGSTAVYFLLRGASFVIQYEKEEKLRKTWEEVCAQFNVCDKAEMKAEWNGQYDDVDVLVMDCEGCEEKLDVDELSRYKQWCVAVHEWTPNRVELLRKLEGTTFTHVSDDGKEIVLCKLTLP